MKMSDTADEIREIMNDIRGERQQGLLLRRLTVGAVLLMFVFFASNIYGNVKAFDTEVLMSTLQKNAAQRLWPMVSTELDAVSVETIPIITDSLAMELRKIGPKLSKAVLAEQAVFQSNMGTYMGKSLTKQIDVHFDEYDGKLNVHYKTLMEDEQLFTDLGVRLQSRSQQWAQEQLDTIFNAHLRSLQSINETVAILGKQTRVPSGDAGTASIDDLVLIFSEILDSRLNAGE